MKEHDLLKNLEDIQDDLATEMIDVHSPGLEKIHTDLTVLMLEIADEGVH